MAGNFERQLAIKRAVDRYKTPPALEQAKIEEPTADEPPRTMTSEEIAAEIERIDAEEAWEADAPRRQAEEKQRLREQRQREVADARKAIEERWAFDRNTRESELRKFDRRQRRKGRS